MKKCITCKKNQNLDQFCLQSKKTGRRKNQCRSCRNTYCKSHYKNNKPSYMSRIKVNNKRYNQESKTLIREGKDKPCLDCGIKYPYYVMQFDHLPQYKKIDGLGQMHRRYKTIVQAEIAKCEVVCANCHAERTYQRSNK